MLIILAAASLFCLTVISGTFALYVWRSQVLRSIPEGIRPEPLGPIRTVSAFLRECSANAAALLLFPLRWRTPTGIDASTSRGAVVLVHDYGSTAGSFWLMRRRLMRHGWRPVVTLCHAARQVDTTAIAAELKTVVDTLAAESPRQIVLVGHGFGGLAIREYARGNPPAAVRRIITVGTPHLGSILPPVFGRLSRAVAPDGPLITHLKTGDPVRRQFDVIAVQSTYDALVLPPKNAEYTGTFNVRLVDYGHCSLLFSYKVFVLIEENLAAPIPPHAVAPDVSA
jgi:pimeloyl-ACP methyl ester carboxylesterase